MSAILESALSAEPRADAAGITPAMKAARRLRVNDLEAAAAAVDTSKQAIVAAALVVGVRNPSESDLLVIAHALHCLVMRSSNQHTECIAALDDALDDVQTYLQDELREQRQQAAAKALEA